MLRFRRYRVLIVFAVVSIFAFYHFTGLRDPARARAALEQLKHFGQQAPLPPPQQPPIPDSDRKEQPQDKTLPPPGEAPPPGDVPHKPAHLPEHVEPPTVDKPHVDTPTSVSTTITVNPPSAPTHPAPNKDPAAGERPPPPAFKPPVFVDPSKKPPEYKEDHNPVEAPFIKDVPWKSLEEHFPVPTESLIPLPTKKANTIPKIQHIPRTESPEQKVAREERLKAVRAAFAHSWSGYKRNAWHHDELTPVSGSFRDTFSGWRATMIDSLDTLWIMGLETEFLQAIAEVGKIDFKVSRRHDLSLFETTIRYLGGLLGAYDVSGQVHQVLLDKAVELANVLMGAFDTPNRMPVTHYYFKPAYLSQAHRAGTRAVLAELGSLTVEFTRLTQLTKDPKYYDAVQRITDALDVWQNQTALPGLWPKRVDASGCVKKSLDPVKDDGNPNTPTGTKPHTNNVVLPPEPPPPPGTDSWKQIDDGTALTKELVKGAQAESGSNYENKLIKEFGEKPNKGGKPSPPYEGQAKVPVPGVARSLNTKRQLVTPGSEYDDPDTDITQSLRLAVAGTDYSIKDCEKQGLATPPYQRLEAFTLNSQADSTYEYLTKEHLLLGGSTDQYRRMYEYAADTAKDYLLFRPMTKTGDYLISGAVEAYMGEYTLDPKSQHLGCFAGGMFAMGSRIFGRAEDLEIGRKLTDGCVWAYESTESGIMPEEFGAVPCQDRKNCKWDEDLWYAYVFPLPNPDEPKPNFETSPRKPAKRDAAPPVEPVAAADRMPYSEVNAAQVQGGPAPNVQEPPAAPPQNAPVAPQVVPQAAPQVPPQAVPNAPAPPQAMPNGAQAAPNGVPPAEANAFPQPPTGASSNRQAGTGQGADGTVPAPQPAVWDPNNVPDTQAGRAQQIIGYQNLPPGFANVISPKYILRPEAIESVFIMYRITGDQSWRDKGWKMFQAIEKHTRAAHGHSAIEDVMHTPAIFSDSMESFWLAETLKYFYLLFSEESLISLDEYVLNTEAHPLKRPTDA